MIEEGGQCVDITQLLNAVEKAVCQGKGARSFRIRLALSGGSRLGIEQWRARTARSLKQINKYLQAVNSQLH
jgi:hypothetical protein